VSAKTSFFICGKCGFTNHPRLGQDGEKCEQCGELRDHPEAVDYDPSRRSG
jgi:hypothetical protein